MSLRIAAPRPCYQVFFDDGASAPLSFFLLDEAGDFSGARPALRQIVEQPVDYDEQLGFLTATIVDEFGVILGYTPIRAIAAQPPGDDGDLSFIYVDDDGAQAPAFAVQPWSARGQPLNADESQPFTAALAIVDEDGLIVGFIRQTQYYQQPVADDEVIGLANFFLDEDSQPLRSPLVAAAIKAIWTDDDQLVITVSAAIDEDAWLPVAVALRGAAAQPAASTDDVLPPAPLAIDDDIYFFYRQAQSPIQFRVFTDDEQLLGKVGPVDEDFFILKPVVMPPVFLPIFDSTDCVGFPFQTPRIIVKPEDLRSLKVDADRTVKPEAGRTIKLQ